MEQDFVTTQQESVVTVTLVDNDSKYDNTIGYYIIGEGGVIQDVRIAFINATDVQSGTAISFTVAGDDPDVGLFIIADGYDVNHSYRKLDLENGELSFLYNYHRPDERPATIYDSARNISLVYSLNGKEIILKGDIYHSLLDGEINNLNKDNLDHAITTPGVDGVITIGFEDLKNLGDRDYNDVLLEVTVSKPDLDVPVNMNTAPVAMNDILVGHEDQILSGNVLIDNGNGADSDVENDLLSVIPAILTTANGGTVTLLANGDFTYTPAVNFFGTDSFEYTLTDTAGNTSLATVTLTIQNVDITGTEGADTLEGTAGADEIYALGDNDTIVDSEGVDFIDGGAGVDTITYAGAARGVQVLLYGTSSDGVRDITVNIENAIGSAYADYIAGDNGDNTLTGLAGNDTLTGNSGNDTLYGGGGLDKLIGGYGNDLLDGGADDDLLYGLDGDDTLEGGDGSDKLYGDVAEGSESFTGNDILRGGAGQDFLYGHGGNDILDGGADSDTIYGGDGNDIASGGTGDDFIYADTGDDILSGGAGSDLLNGGGGTDLLTYETALGAVNANLQTGFATDGEGGTDTLYGIENIRGSSFNDTLTGDNLANRIEGLNGNDVINALGGDDTVYGGDGLDTIYGGDGLDTLYGDAGNDLLYGMNGNDVVRGGVGDDKIYGDLLTGTELYTGNDVLYGEDGNDIIYGHGGNDILIGGNGADTLYGGAGADTFKFEMKDNIADAIKDFTLNGAEKDVIDITDLLSGFDPLTSDINDFVELRYWSASRTDLKINADGQGTDFVTIAVINGSDFAGTSVETLFANGQIIAA